MKRRDALKVAAIGSVGLVAGVSCAGNTGNSEEKKEKEMNKYTNEYFYDNDKLNPEKALNAYKEMFEFYDYPMDDFLAKNMFISDFGLGDFANCGMAGVFWINDEKFGYFAHEIYLLPGQMIVEHSHMKTENSAKMESWHVRHGSIYNFGEGETTPNNPKTPESQKDFITVSSVNELKLNGIQTLNREEAPHFMMAGNQGAIVSEYANFHDGAGLKFTNPNVQFTDVLGNI